ncbi:DUF222 domain-containing protein [Microbacterium sp. DT81.1]|uniref:HNH endonuclease signature motif containing protein n=1 Tax=Microbacterium sp. DT81.1 TaxID=3393413 RepID=UPI003CF53D1B
MFFEPEMTPDAAGNDAELGGASEDESVVAARAAAALNAPDTLDHVVEIADMITMHAAQRLIGIDLARREALADAARHGRGLVEVVERSVRLEIAAALRITEHAADGLLSLGEALVHRYPAVLDSFAVAGMTERHAQLLVDALDSVEPEFRDRIVGPGIVLAESQPVGTFRRKLRTLVESVRAATLEERNTAALQRRRVIVEPAEDGMAWFSALIPAVEAHAAMGRVTTIAKVLGGRDEETRTLDQLRADVFADLLIEGETVAHPPEARGIRATVAVTIPVLALLENDKPGTPAAGGATGTTRTIGGRGDPPTVEGIGPIPLSRARELCGSAEGWMRILTHPESGMVLSVGREQYRPPPGLRRLVRWRADSCMAPGCAVPASRCEIDHTIAWQDGGTTTLDNHAPLCKGHHIVKHHGGWSVTQIEGSGGAIQWVSPTGRRYIVQPERRVPVFRAQPDDDAPF